MIWWGVYIHLPLQLHSVNDIEIIDETFIIIEWLIVMLERNTRKQHYIQKALIELWAKDGFVDTLRKECDGTIVKGKQKSPKAIFYDLFTYEQVYGFDSAKEHLKNGMTVSADSNHIFRMNDGEIYCKNIEDSGFPVIREILINVKNGSETMFLSNESKKCLCQYLVLQALRTPAGRKEYQIDYKPREISLESTTEETLDSYISNLTYLFYMGVYDSIGISDKFEKPESPFQHLLNIIKDMKGYVLYLTNKETGFIMGDNPCVFLGKKEGISSVLMPLTPDVMLILIAEEKCADSNKMEIYACPNEWLSFEHFCQIQTAQQKIIYNGEKVSIDEIQEDYRNSSGNIIGLDIWTIKKMVESFDDNDLNFCI